MNFIKNYFYNKKLKAEQLLEAQRDISRIHSVLITLVAENKVEADKADERHRKLLYCFDETIKELVGLSGSLDNFLQSQAGMANLIKKFLKIEIDNAIVDSVIEKEEPTEHDKRF